jgi:hypothetical protein
MTEARHFSVWTFCLNREGKSSLDRDEPDATNVFKKNQNSSLVTIFLKLCSSSDLNTGRSWYDKVIHGQDVHLNCFVKTQSGEPSAQATAKQYFGCPTGNSFWICSKTLRRHTTPPVGGSYSGFRTLLEFECIILSHLRNSTIFIHTEEMHQIPMTHLISKWAEYPSHKLDSDLQELFEYLPRVLGKAIFVNLVVVIGRTFKCPDCEL